jgi:hypothetical protein
VATFASSSGISTWAYWSSGMSSSSVYFTPCWAGKKPVIRVDRAGEHMQLLVKAFSKVTRCRCSRVSPGRFSFAHPGGKCWIARSWSVMNITTFIPAMLRPAAPLTPFTPTAALPAGGALRAPPFPLLARAILEPFRCDVERRIEAGPCNRRE